MLTKEINLKNFKINKNSLSVKKNLISLINSRNEVLKSLSDNYKNNYTKKFTLMFKKLSNFRVIGMGGSILGSKAIYGFLKEKVKKNFVFIDSIKKKKMIINKSNFTNFVISKSGNTLETIVSANILLKKKDKNIFITEKKNSYLHDLAQKLKADIVHHNNFIGGRYSVLSEVGMLPAELMGLNPNNFRQLNSLIKNKRFINSLIINVSSILHLIKRKKYNSIILNYDDGSEDLFKWYQQLIAESLGKKRKGLLPIISNMPKDNHSVMQLYLDGIQNNFFTFFHVKEKKSQTINSKKILPSKKYLINKNLSQIITAQKSATENIFKKKNIPFRSFEIENKDEKTLGELFCFFILETILLGKSMNLNPYDQPAVELVKKETKKILI